MLSRQASCPFLGILMLPQLQSCSPGISREMTGDFPHLFVEKGTGASGRRSGSAGCSRLLPTTDSAGRGRANLLGVAPALRFRLCHGTGLTHTAQCTNLKYTAHGIFSSVCSPVTRAQMKMQHTPSTPENSLIPHRHPPPMPALPEGDHILTRVTTADFLDL